MYVLRAYTYKSSEHKYKKITLPLSSGKQDIYVIIGADNVYHKRNILTLGWVDES